MATHSIQPDGTKTCTRCGEVKQRTEFYKHPGCHEGLSAHCKICHAQMVKVWHDRQPGRERNSWSMAKERCFNPNNGQYVDYGGRGITMCDEWKHSFEAFYRDMGPRPANTSLNRLDVDGHYEPSNCNWATRTEQARNRTNTVWLTVGGVTLQLDDWAEMCGLPSDVVRSRIARYGWPPELALALRVHRRLPVLDKTGPGLNEEPSPTFF